MPPLKGPKPKMEDDKKSVKLALHVAACLVVSLLDSTVAAWAQDSKRVYCGQEFMTFQAASANGPELQPINLQKRHVHSVMAGIMVVARTDGSAQTLVFPKEDHDAIVSCLD